MRRAVPVIFVCLAMLTGCGPGTQAPVPTMTPQVAPVPATIPPPTSSPKEPDDNPYGDSVSVYSESGYSVWEAYRGSDPVELSQERGFTYLDYDVEIFESWDGGSWRYANHTHLPQCPGEDEFAINFSRHYRAVYDDLRERAKTYLEISEEGWLGEIRRGLTMRDEFLWNGFYQVFLLDEQSGGRVFIEPVVEVFDGEIGIKVELEALFSGRAEDWLPELGQRLKEKGFLPPMDQEESAELLRDPMYFDIERAVETGADVFRNFMLTPNGLGFAFQTGNVSFIAAGPIIVVVAYADISDLLTSEFQALLCP